MAPFSCCVLKSSENATVIQIFIEKNHLEMNAMKLMNAQQILEIESQISNLLSHKDEEQRWKGICYIPMAIDNLSTEKLLSRCGAWLNGVIPCLKVILNLRLY